MNDCTRINISATDADGDSSMFSYSFQQGLTVNETLDFGQLFVELLHYTPDQVREAIQNYQEYKIREAIQYDFNNQTAPNGAES